MAESREGQRSPQTPQEGCSSPWDDDRRPHCRRQVRHALGAGQAQPRAQSTGSPVLLGDEVPVGLDVLTEGAGICVALQAARLLAVVRLVHVVSTSVFETVAGVGVPFAAAFVGTNVGFLSWTEKNRGENGFMITGSDVDVTPTAVHAGVVSLNFRSVLDKHTCFSVKLNV